MTAALEVAGVRKSYQDLVALDGVDFRVEPGEMVGLLGPNGAGKTTLVSIICGLRRADSGSVSVCGVDALSHPQLARKHIGLAPQELGIYPVDKVKQTLSFFGELGGLRGTRLAAQISNVAGSLRLDELMDRKAGELSGGQKRRLHTAIALLTDPPLVLLDEATTGADVETRAALLELVSDLADRGSAVLYSTHYLGEVEDLGARVLILDRGRVIADGSIPELTSSSGGSYVELVFPDFERRVPVDDPKRDLMNILNSLGPESENLQSVEIIHSSIEAVFLELTGRRYEPEEQDNVGVS
jgi:ABC-2 type transport system ATP-binding protein